MQSEEWNKPNSIPSLSVIQTQEKSGDGGTMTARSRKRKKQQGKKFYFSIMSEDVKENGKFSWGKEL